MKAFITFKPLLLVCLCGSITALLFAEPAWWVQRGVRDPAKSPSDYAALNQGQLKNLARAARDEMEAHLPGGAGTAVNTLVNAWGAASGNTKDYAAVNGGQLKAVAKPFYDRLMAAGQPVTYPWSASAADDVDFAAVNIGQAKRVFSFEVMTDTDGDGMDDLWETQFFGNLSRTGLLDADGDGLSDLQEYQRGLNPAVWDTNGDLVGDAFAAASAAELQVRLVVYTPVRN
ncbi:MAG: hypothetical protein K1X78_01075 [Verrucomicrobiaceae bacterium]|nr:hypothetical protein [Verrucomicrobiaceae bacterium]